MHDSVIFTVTIGQSARLVSYAWLSALRSGRNAFRTRLRGGYTPLIRGSCHTPGGGGGLLAPLPLCLQRVGLQIFYSPKGAFVFIGPRESIVGRNDHSPPNWRHCCEVIEKALDLELSELAGSTLRLPPKPKGT